MLIIRMIDNNCGKSQICNTFDLCRMCILKKSSLLQSSISPRIFVTLHIHSWKMFLRHEYFVTYEWIAL